MSNTYDTTSSDILGILCEVLGLSDEKIKEALMNKIVSSDTKESVDVKDAAEYKARIKTYDKGKVKEILDQWKDLEQDIVKLYDVFGIDIWSSSEKNSLYTKYNMLIKNLLFLVFGEHFAGELEAWTFDVDDNTIPSFDQFWEKLINNINE